MTSTDAPRDVRNRHPRQRQHVACQGRDICAVGATVLFAGMRRPAGTRRPQAGSCQAGPPGFTLLEMLLVLAILVAITAVTIPVVERMYDTHRIQQAAMEVRTALSAARLRAVDGGQTLECRFEPDGRHLVVLVNVDRGIRFGQEEDRRGESKQRAAEGIHIELPEPLYFWTADPTRERLQATAGAWADGNSLAGHTWSAPVVFTPNGSSTNATFEIRDRQGRTVRLDVRGLTGAASSSALVTRSAE